MMDFNLLYIKCGHYRCVLGERLYFDFKPKQYTMFTDTYYSFLKDAEGEEVFNMFTKEKVGEVVSVRHLKYDNEIWILILNKIRGELFRKVL